MPRFSESNCAFAIDFRDSQFFVREGDVSQGIIDCEVFEKTILYGSYGSQIVLRLGSIYRDSEDINTTLIHLDGKGNTPQTDRRLRILAGINADREDYLPEIYWQPSQRLPGVLVFVRPRITTSYFSFSRSL